MIEANIRGVADFIRWFFIGRFHTVCHIDYGNPTFTIITNNDTVIILWYHFAAAARHTYVGRHNEIGEISNFIIDVFPITNDGLFR